MPEKAARGPSTPGKLALVKREMRAQFETHDSTAHRYWPKAQKITLPDLTPTDLTNLSHARQTNRPAKTRLKYTQ